MGLIRGFIPHWADVFSSYGYGDGYGYGSGSGYGYGDGDGSGYGYGSGSGSGDGSGSGYGSGYGYGDGYGYGYGYGYGSGYWWTVLQASATKWSSWASGRLRELMTDPSVYLAFWRSNASGKPSNGGHSPKAAVEGLVQEVQGPLILCGSHALHATLKPEKWSGDRLWVVALHGQVLVQDDKAGALKREIIAEIK